MEQKKINIVTVNDKKKSMNDNKIRVEEEEVDQEVVLGVPVHSQVMKIKQEIEKIKHPSLQQQEMRRVMLRAAYDRPQRSRSPLGKADRERPISVHN